MTGMLTERTIALDILHSVKLEMLLDGRSLATCSHSQVRSVFRQMTHDHEAIHEELLALIRSRGWRRDPQADQRVASQLVRHFEQARRARYEQVAK